MAIFCSADNQQPAHLTDIVFGMAYVPFMGCRLVQSNYGHNYQRTKPAMRQSHRVYALNTVP